MKRTKAQISYNMSMVRSRGSVIEKIMAKSMRSARIPFKTHPKDIFGHPDFVLTKSKIAIFCDSSFWHGYRQMKTQRHNFKTNRVFWKNKIGQNIQRDKIVKSELKKEGWIVLRFWDFEIKKKADRCIDKIKKVIQLQK